jgi:hypothetical protein
MNIAGALWLRKPGGGWYKFFRFTPKAVRV